VIIGDWLTTSPGEPPHVLTLYLRDQANKCRWHAKHIGDAETQVELIRLGKEYAEEAAAIETKEKEPPPPTLWLPSQSPQGPDTEAPDGVTV
jgi:hypothetical protein